MKRVLLFLGMFSSVAYAQDCSKIFISEYVEGWSNNKALEIYNPTSSPVDLSQYFVTRYSNGGNTATVKNSIQLSGTIQPYDVFVAVIDMRLPGTGQDAPIWDSLEVRADAFFCPDYDLSDAFYWNGNDAVLLAKGSLGGKAPSTVINSTNILGFQIIDIFGKIGENPANEQGQIGSSVGGGWATTWPYNNGQGVLLSIDHSLIRKSAIKKGVTANPTYFNPLGEWDSIPAVTYVNGPGGTPITGANGPILFGNWFSLGTHNCDCNPLSTNELKVEDVAIYPNPTTDGVIYAKNTQDIKEVVVYNALGQKVNTLSNNASALMSIRVGNDKGVYIVRFMHVNGSSVTKRIVLK